MNQGKFYIEIFDLSNQGRLDSLINFEVDHWDHLGYRYEVQEAFENYKAKSYLRPQIEDFIGERDFLIYCGYIEKSGVSLNYHGCAGVWRKTIRIEKHEPVPPPKEIVVTVI